MIRNPFHLAAEQRKITRRAVVGGGIALAATLGSKPAFATDPDFTIVMIPDTQYMAYSCGSAFNAMMTWVANNLNTSQGGVFTTNVKAVIGVGDCAHQATSGEYTGAQTAYAILTSAGVPWVNPPGNHDYDNSLNNRSTGLGSGYTAGGYFSAGQRALATYGALPTGGGTSAWGGSYDTANYYIKLTIGSQKIIVASLEFQPRAVVLNWAKQVHDSHPSHAFIISTHSFLGCQNNLMAFSGEPNGGTAANDNSAYGLGTAQATSDGSFNSGYGMWNSYLNVWPRLTMVMNGHDYFEFQDAPAYHFKLKQLTSSSAKAQTVQALFANYQQWEQPSGAYDGRASQGSATGQPNVVAPNQPTGYCTLLSNNTWRIGHVVLLQFRPSQGTVEVYCIATNSGKWEQAYADRATAPDTTPHLLLSGTYTGVAGNLFPQPGALG